MCYHYTTRLRLKLNNKTIKKTTYTPIWLHEWTNVFMVYNKEEGLAPLSPYLTTIIFPSKPPILRSLRFKLSFDVLLGHLMTDPTKKGTHPHISVWMSPFLVYYLLVDGVLLAGFDEQRPRGQNRRQVGCLRVTLADVHRCGQRPLTRELFVLDVNLTVTLNALDRYSTPC